MDTRHNGFCRSEPTVKISILCHNITIKILINFMFLNHIELSRETSLRKHVQNDRPFVEHHSEQSDTADSIFYPS